MKKGDVGMAKRFSKKVRKQVKAVMRDVASGADRNLGITFGLHVVDSSRTMVDILLC